MRNLSAIVLLFILSGAYAQEIPDSLKALLRSKLPPTEQFKVLENLIEQYKYDDRPQSLQYGKQAYQYGKRETDKSIQAKGCELLGNAYFINFEYDSALRYLKEGLSLIDGNSENALNMYLYAGDAFWFNGLFDSSLVYYVKGKAIAHRTNNLNMLATLTINMADYYRQRSNYDKALDIYWEGLAYAKQDPSGSVLPKAYNNTALLFGYLGDTYTELNYYFKAIEVAQGPCCSRSLGLLYSNVADSYATLGDNVRAIQYAKTGIEKSKEAGQLRYLMFSYEMLGTMYMSMDSIDRAREAVVESIRRNEQVKDKRYVARNLGHMGDLERREKKYARAIDYYQRAIAAHELIGEKKYKAEDLHGLAKTFFEQGNLTNAKKYNQEAMRLAVDLGIRPLYAESTLLNAEIMSKSGDLKQALRFQKKYDSVKTVMAKEDRMKYLNNLENLSEARIKELENLSLRKDMEVQAGVIDRQEKFFAAGIAMIFLLMAISFFILWLLRRNQSAKKLISSQNIALINKNEEIQAMSDQQENLMHLVVHDLRSPLNKIEGLVNILRLEGGLSKGQEELATLMEDVTRKSKSFISEYLETSQVQYHSKQPKKNLFNLIQFLEDIQKEYTTHASKKEIAILTKFELPDQPAYSDRNLLYHIIINLLSNAIKYSPARTHIQLNAWRDADKLGILIKDEGQGFSEKDKQMIFKKFQRLSARPIGGESSTGLGLFLTKLLVDSLGGKISLESEENKGSTFTLLFNDVFDQKRPHE